MTETAGAETVDESRSVRIVAPEEAAGQRIDSYLAGLFDDISRSQVRRAIERGDVLVDDSPVKPSHSLKAGEVINFEPPESLPIEAVPEDIPLDIIHEDAEIIVINKPAGMVTHPGAGINSGTLANALVHHLNTQAQQLPKRGGSSRPGIVHRLDVGTSGVIVAAKTDRAHLALAEQFEGRTIHKLYTALVYGRVAEDDGRIEAPIGRDPRNRVRMSIQGQGRYALTLFKTVERFDELTLLDVEIRTGRTHQIRVHLAHFKHPVAGDSLYDGGRINNVREVAVRKAISGLGRPFLHASKLRLVHPVTGETMEFSAPLPAELENLLSLLRA
ncbi:MAG: RluA family pseudouridine synthase [Blastocatellales bacterium]